jgi:murein DD-endopeptidase MepM/ murein hydrolase activator NlpD
MQIIWISGSTSRIKRINITARVIVRIVAIIALCLIIIGAGIHFLGFRVAVQLKPELAREIGGVISIQEKEQLEANYQSLLADLQTRLTNVNDQVSKLQFLKQRFQNLATPNVIKQKFQQFNNQGGPLLPSQMIFPLGYPLLTSFEATLDSAKSFNAGLEDLERSWQEQYTWLLGLPTQYPIQYANRLSSNYGVRVDPFTGTLAQHPGVDFSAPSGTPILAAASGKVIAAGKDPAYGNYVEIEHADGFTTKYGHARKLNVKEGQVVARGQMIAEVGSTGRSTGPHLHYEVLLDGRHINPIALLKKPKMTLAANED